MFEGKDEQLTVQEGFFKAVGVVKLNKKNQGVV